MSSIIVKGIDANGDPQPLLVGTDGSLTGITVSIGDTIAATQSGAWTVSTTPTPSTPLLLNAIAVKTLVRGSAGVLAGFLSVYNPNAVDIWLQVFDAASTGAVSLGTTAPVIPIWLPPLSAYDSTFAPITFSSGIVVAPTTTPTGSTLASTGVTGTALHRTA